MSLPAICKPLMAALVLCTALLGCATAPDATPGISDPLEPMNRKIYAFNVAADRYVIKPVAKGYRAVTPDFARAGVRNFFSNLGDFSNTINDVLQGQFSQALNDGGRFVVNSTAGVLGLFDVATEIGLPKHYEDFGQTLGEWGVGSGPYLVLPFLGPSSMRDGVGVVVDSQYTSPLSQLDSNVALGATVLRAVDLRARYLNADRLISQSSLDPYVFMRDSYFQQRRNVIRREAATAAEEAPAQTQAEDLSDLESLDDLEDLDALE